MKEYVDLIKQDILDRFRIYPVMSKSMVGTNFFDVPSEVITNALKSLEEEGYLLRGAKPGKQRATAFFYLASEAERLAPFIGSVKK